MSGPEILDWVRGLAVGVVLPIYVTRGLDPMDSEAARLVQEAS